MPRINIKHERPDYVLNFQKPPYTEIKYVRGHWYLYSRESVVLEDGTRKKKSGKIIGKITPNGLVYSRKRKREKLSELQNDSDAKATVTVAEEPAVSNEKPKQTQSQEDKPVTIKHETMSDTVEVGAVTYFYSRSLSLRNRLKKYFPDNWQFLYVIALMRLIYGPHFRRIKLHYQTSMAGEIFPGLDLSPVAIRNLLVELGKKRATIREFMMEDLIQDGTYLLVDGHRLITASEGRDLAELGYDSKHRYKPQINLLYLFKLTESLGLPAYYKQYAGSTPDVTAFEDLLNDCNLSAENIIAVTDKGFASEDGFDLLVESGLNYVMPLKRNNTFVKGKIPVTPADYTYAFLYSNRCIFFSEIETAEEDDFRIYIYCDMSLYKEEMTTLVGGVEKKNTATEKKVETELKRREKKKGKLSDEKLAELKPLELSKVLDDKPSVGTITLRVRAKDLNGQQAFCVWKTRQAIEQFFKTYDDTLRFDSSYMQDDISEEGRLFLNHLSAIMAIEAIDEIARLGHSKDISLNDLLETLRTIQADCIDGAWMVKPIKSEVTKLASKMELDIADLSTFDSIIKWERNPDIQHPPKVDNSDENEEDAESTE